MQQSRLAGCLSAGLLYAFSGVAQATCDFDIEVDDSMACWLPTGSQPHR
ncbi:hypothetical protein [Thiohalocapsa halophila]|nr:hypothetical protein [Thiohalocapsa halophila]